MKDYVAISFLILLMSGTTRGSQEMWSWELDKYCCSGSMSNPGPGQFVRALVKEEGQKMDRERLDKQHT